MNIHFYSHFKFFSSCFLLFNIYTIMTPLNYLYSLYTGTTIFMITPFLVLMINYLLFFFFFHVLTIFSFFYVIIYLHVNSSTSLTYALRVIIVIISIVYFYCPLLIVLIRNLWLP